MALALLCLLVAEPTRRPAPKSALFAAARALAGVPVYRLATLGYCAHTAAIGAFAFWAPKYLVTRYGMPLGRASATFGLVTVVCGFVGTIVGGWLADAAVRARSIPSASPSIADDRATARANLTVCVLSAALGAPLAAAAILAPTPTVFFVLLVPCEIALFVSNSPVNVAMLRSAPPGLRASAMALGIFAIHLLGDLWSPPLVGLVADHAPWTLAMMAAPIGFGIAALVWQGGANAPSDRLT